MNSTTQESPNRTVSNVPGIVTPTALNSRQAWFKSWFDSSFYHQLYGNRNEKEAQNFIDELLNRLQPHPQSSMLDLGCGAGRHAKYLAAKGYNVEGTDLSAASIRTAGRSASGNLHFFRHDMRVPFGHNRYNYVFNFFTSFGYFGQTGNEQVIRNMWQALKPGGTLVIDYMNAPWSEARMVASEQKEIDGVFYQINRWSDHEHIYKKITIDCQQEENLLEHIEQVAKISLSTFSTMFSRTGLILEQVFGDYQLNNYDHLTSPRLILVAKKSL